MNISIKKIPNTDLNIYICCMQICRKRGLLWWLSGKESASSGGDVSSTLGLGRSPSERNGNKHQCSCLENPMDRGAWWAIVHGVTRVIYSLRG